MLKLLAIALVAGVAAGIQLSLAADSSAPPQYADVRTFGTDRKKGVDPAKYFVAKQNREAISEQDTLDLIREYGHSLQLYLAEWSIDHEPQGEEGKSVYPAGDKLDAELNTWTDKFKSYTGKDKDAQGPGFYPNPVTSTDLHNFDAMAIPFGWTPDAPGNFSYLYQLDDQGHAAHYILLFYGLKKNAGFDVNGDGVADGVILELVDNRSAHVDKGKSWYCNSSKVTGIRFIEQK